ncbi:hypothetical protein [Clostridium paraputrificum]|nr:hypothetical protein [Clostridium paraputrificum]
MENKYVRVGNGVLYIHNLEEHGVVEIPMKEADMLLNEIIQAIHLIKNN